VRKNFRYSLLLLCLILSACVSPVEKLEPSPTVNTFVSVMVLGTDHFAGGNNDVVNTKPDNVLLDHRQSELKSIATALLKFRPTVIATERVTEAPLYIDRAFVDYKEEWLQTNPDERVQLAYRIARLAGIDRVYGLDEQSDETEPDYFPFEKLQSHVAATGQLGEFETYLADFTATMKSGLEAVEAESIAKKLNVINSPPYSDADFYYGLLKFDRGEMQPAAELNAYWFMRNAKIFSKLQDVTKPGDRVLVVYGAGHKYWLEKLAMETPGFKAIDPRPYLQRLKALCSKSIRRKNFPKKYLRPSLD